VVFWIVISVIVVFILAPLLVVAATSVTATGYITFPPQGFSLEWYGKAFANDKFLEGLVTSVQLGLATTVITVVLGVLASYAITRYDTRTTRALEQIFLSPLLLPGVVLGLGILFLLSAVGLRGSFAGGLLAHVIIASPFVVRACLAGLRQLDPRLLEASRSLGAGGARTILQIIVPSIAGSIASGAMFAFVISFDEAVVTLFLTGPRFETLPITILTSVQYSNDPSVAAVSTVIVVICAVLVGLVGKFSGGRDERA
jgi:putative spermidine/putrescine transport system permease protein